MLVSNTVLAFMYTYVFYRMKQVMNKFVGDFDYEIWSVNIQFLVFFIAQFIRIAHMILFEVSKARNSVRVEFFNRSSFAITFVTQILPTFVVLVLHQKAFSARV